MREGWEYKKLGEVATLINGFAFQSAMFQKAGLPIVRISNIQDDKITSDFVYFNRGDYNIDFEKYEVLYGDILIAMSGATTGKVGINYNDEVLYLNQRVGKIVPRENIIHRYLFYYLKTNAAKSLSIAQGVAQPNLSTQQINSFVLPVPPLSEQQRIVSELDLLSSIIEKKKAQLKEYDQLAQSIFYDMFGDPVTNEKGWEVKKLGEIGTIIAGSTPSTNDESNWDGDVNWVTPAELGEQLYYGETVRKLTEKGAKGLTMMPVGTVLLSSRAPIGKLAITTVPMCCNQGFKNIVCGKGLNNVFLFFFLKNTMNLIQSLGRGATFKEVSKSSILKYLTILPPLPLQQSFASKIEAIERQKALIQQSIAEVQMLFDSRMDDWFA